MRTENQTPARPPLDLAALRQAAARAAVRPGGLWRTIEVVESTGSTNADLLARALAGEPEGTVLATEDQRAGRGRLGRTWITPPRAALTFSLLVRPSVPPARRGWLPLLTGLAVAGAITSVTGVETTLKWPNDVLAGPPDSPGKLAGILAEVAKPVVVIGLGLNVTQSADEIDGPGATSLLDLGVDAPDRTRLVSALLKELGRRIVAWRAARGADWALAADYRARSLTIGNRVRAHLPGGKQVDGTASAIDDQGRLCLESGGQTVVVAAGDVVHLR
jgi:BirA family transcriptional regulator, biotin operon repressor / biotin---[acetyl-CoA-carboxylase] ligase